MPVALLPKTLILTATLIDMSDLYLTIPGPAEASLTEKRSKFLAFAWPVTTPEQALERVGDLAKKYYDARHVCWAYMLGADRLTFRANDNGEPSGTAGKPILGQINSLGLTDVVVAVVRYFGGIKLGTPGLIAAYRQAARLVLEEAGSIERHVMAKLAFTYPYIAMNDVMKLTRSSGVIVDSAEYDNLCRLSLTVELDRLQSLRRSLADIDGLCFDD